MRMWGHGHLRFVSHCYESIIVFHSWDPNHGARRPCSPERSSEPHSAGGIDISESDYVIPFAGGETERNTHGGTPRRMTNSVDNLRMLSPGGSSIESGVNSSYRIGVHNDVRK